MHWVTCPRCNSKLNAFHPQPPTRAFWDSLEGVVECPTCHAAIRQQPSDGVLTGILLLGWMAIGIIGVSLGATFEILISLMFLWTAGIAIWAFKRKWVVARELSNL